MRAPILLLLFALAPGAAGAVTGYADCAALVERDAERARNEAVAWYSATGSLAALHCEALALARQGAYRLAAEKLEAIARSPELDPEQQAEVLTQAAALRRDFGDLEGATETLGRAVAAAKGGPGAATPLIERAALHAAGGDFAAAKDDLDGALRLRPKDAEALALRAATERRLGDLLAARRDAEAAVAADPARARGRLELGLARAGLGDPEGAREAFLAAISAEPAAPAAALARSALQDLDAPEGRAAAAAPDGRPASRVIQMPVER